MMFRKIPCLGRLVGAGALLAAVCLAGCGDSGPKLYPIRGEVTYMGEPVPMGTIRFEPVGQAMDPRATPETLIRDGRYELSRKEGVLGGSYKVYIRAYDGKTRPDSDMAYGNALFPPYYVTQVDLPPEGGTFDFHIPEQKGGRKR